MELIATLLLIGRLAHSSFISASASSLIGPHEFCWALPLLKKAQTLGLCLFRFTELLSNAKAQYWSAALCKPGACY